jgi:hypothetical protein
MSSPRLGIGKPGEATPIFHNQLCAAELRAAVLRQVNWGIALAYKREPKRGSPRLTLRAERRRLHQDRRHPA